MDKILDFLLQEKVIAPILILIGNIIVYKIIVALVKKFINRGKEGFEKKRRKTISELATNIIKVFIYAIAIMMILDVYGVDTKGILASLGIAGIVVGLALQNTVEDLMSGIIIILDNYYMIGDIIKVNDFEGEVIDLTLKSTKVKNEFGEVYIYANRNMTSVINMSNKEYAFRLEIPTSYEDDINKVEKVLTEVMEKVKKIEGVNDSKYLGLNKLDNSSVNYAIIIYCKTALRFTVKRSVLKMIKLAYDKENIKIPYQQIEVRSGK